MAQSYGPFSSGAGFSFGETGWSSLIGGAIPDGVIKHVSALVELNKLAVTATNTILGVHVASGRAAIRGHWYENDASTNVLVAAADATNPRIDYIVLELDRAADTITLKAVTGTPAGSPVAPALTRNASVWQIPLAQVRVEAATALIAADKVTDSRLYAQSVRMQKATAAGGDTCGTTIEDMPDMAITMWTDGGDVEVSFSGIVSNDSLNNAVRVYAQVDGGSNVQRGEHTSSTATATGTVSFTYPITGLAAGLHTFKIRYAAAPGGTGSVAAGREMIVREYR